MHTLNKSVGINGNSESIMNQLTVAVATKNEIAGPNKVQKPSPNQFFGLDCLELRRRNSLPFRSKASIQYRAPTRTQSFRAHEGRPSSWNPSTHCSSLDVDDVTRISLKNTKRSPSCDRYFNEEDLSQLNPESMRMRPPRPPSASSIGEVTVGRVADMVRKVEQNLQLSTSENFSRDPFVTANKERNVVRSHTINTPNVFIYSTCINQMECDKTNKQNITAICPQVSDFIQSTPDRPSHNYPHLFRSSTLPNARQPEFVQNSNELNSVEKHANHIANGNTSIAGSDTSDEFNQINRGDPFLRMEPNGSEIAPAQQARNKNGDIFESSFRNNFANTSEADISSDNSMANQMVIISKEKRRTTGESVADTTFQNNDGNDISEFSQNFSELIEPITSLSLSNQPRYTSASSLKFLDIDSEPRLTYNSSREHNLMETSYARYLPSGSASSRTPSPPLIIKEPVNSLEWLAFKRSNIIYPSISLYELCQFCDIATVFVSSTLISVNRLPFWWRDDPVSSLGLKTCIARVCIEGATACQTFQLSSKIRTDGDADRNASSTGAFKIVTPRPCMTNPVVLLIEDIIPGSPVAAVSGIHKGQILVELNGINLLSTGSSNKSVLLHLLMNSAMQELDCGDELGIRFTVASPDRSISRFENGSIYIMLNQKMEQQSREVERNPSSSRCHLRRKQSNKISSGRNARHISPQHSTTPASSCSPTVERVILARKTLQ